MRKPAHRARDGEQHGEHRHREAERLVDQAGVEVDVGVQLVVDEVRIGQCGFLQLQRDVEQGVLARHLKDFVGGLLDDRRPRVVVLVDPVAEAGEASALAALHFLDEGRHVVERADVGQHAHRTLVGTTVRRAVQRRSSSSSSRVRVGPARADDAHRSGAAVLLVVGVEDEQHIHRPLEARIDFVIADLPHHVQEVGRE